MATYFNTYDDALDSINPAEGAGDELRVKAAKHIADERESFQRCDTDGFLSQWASSCGAEKARAEADLADNGGLSAFPVLVDIETDKIVGEKLFTFFNKFAGYGERQVWLVERNGQTEWVGDAVRATTFAKKGLKKVYVTAEAFIGSTESDPFYKLPAKRGLSGITGVIGYGPIRKMKTYKWKEKACT